MSRRERAVTKIDSAVYVIKNDGHSLLNASSLHVPGAEVYPHFGEEINEIRIH